MSEDRLDRALHELRQEDVDAATLEAARARAWESLAKAGGSTCAEFRPDFHAYLAGELAGNRRVLLEDHLSRCTACRASIAEMKGERRVVAMPVRSRYASRIVRWGGMAAAAALVLAVAYLGRGTIDAWMAPGGPRATVVSADGGLYLLPGGSLAEGAAIGEKELVRTSPGAHAVLRLADGSLLDVNERTEFYVTAAWSGQTVHLQRGDIIVRAAPQRRGRLRVTTRDSIASVKGTVFAVSAGMGGSVVSVAAGSVAVNQPGREVLLSAGEQAASNPGLETPIHEAFGWSPDAHDYFEMLGSLATIERELAEDSPVALRTTSELLQYLPHGAVIYGAVPNMGGTISRALSLAGQQAAENDAFGAWWNSEIGLELREIVGRVQSVSSLLGDEVVFCASLRSPAEKPVPMVMARVQPGRGEELASALAGLFEGTGEEVPPYTVVGGLLVVSDSPAKLSWAVGHLGQGAGSPFAAAIAGRYQRGAGWLMGMDAEPLVANLSGDDAPPVEFAGMLGMKYLFLEQRAPAGAEENEVTLVFEGPRKGMASWLAEAGAGGAAEYLPADALLAGYVSTREPLQLFGDFMALVTKEDPSFQRDLAEVDAKLGAGFMERLAAALGTESAFALTGFSVGGPSWVMAGVANTPPVIDESLRKLVDLFNSALPSEHQDKRIVFVQESVNGRVWNTLKPASLPFGATWTYDRGYMVVGSDRALAERAIATRNAGSPLVWTPEFLGQLPSSAGMHPSAFFWLNTKGALGAFSTLAPNPALASLLAARDPILVVFDATMEQIHAASRTRISRLIVDVMLLESLGRAGQQLGAGTAGQ